MLWACDSPNSWDCIQVSGKKITERRDFNSFAKVSIFDKIDVEIIQADHYAVEIVAGENVVAGISTKISGDRLEIGNENTCELLRNSDKLPLLRLYFDTIESLEVLSSGTVRSIDTIRIKKLNLSKRSNSDMILTLQSDNVFIYSNEYGDAIFHGKIKNISVEQEGIGWVDFSQTMAENAYVITRGPGTTKVNVSDKVSGIISGNGILEVYGDPEVREVNVKDDGRIIFNSP